MQFHLPLLILAFLLAACGSDNAEPGQVDAGPADAGVVDAAPPDATPKATFEAGEPFVLSVGNENGQDEDPAVLRSADGSIYVAWYSNRNGIDAQGREDKELFLTHTTDGVSWSTPLQITQSPEFSLYPALAQDASGTIHVVWWRVNLLPSGCTVNVDCTGTDNRIMHNSSADGSTWDLDNEVEIASGPGDWLPSIVYDDAEDRLLVYFSSIVRNADGTTNLGESTTRIYLTTKSDEAWSSPVRINGVNPDASHNSYSHVVQKDDGTFLMTWTRYDAAASNTVLQVILEPSTETMLASSVDGINWSVPLQLSGGPEAGAIDAFPWLHANHQSSDFFVTWIAAVKASTTVEMPIDGSFPEDSVQRPELRGYTSRVIPTSTSDLFFATWVEGNDPTQQVFGRFFSK